MYREDGNSRGAVQASELREFITCFARIWLWWMANSPRHYAHVLPFSIQDIMYSFRCFVVVRYVSDSAHAYFRCFRGLVRCMILVLFAPWWNINPAPHFVRTSCTLHCKHVGSASYRLAEREWNVWARAGSLMPTETTRIICRGEVCAGSGAQTLVQTILIWSSHINHSRL